MTHLSTKPGPEEEARGRAHDQHQQQQQQQQDEKEESEEESDIDDDSDPGTSWFSEHRAPEKVVEFLTNESFPLAPCNIPHPHPHHHRHHHEEEEEEGKGGGRLDILDLGTGNGSMLALLRNSGFAAHAKMVGVDYSSGSVELARQLQRLRLHSAYHHHFGHEEDQEEDIRFEEWDILSPKNALDDYVHLDWFPYRKGGFDLVLDKGTFDAVSLSGQKGVCERYPCIAGKLVRKGGFLIVTSCNWTEEELVRWFTTTTDEMLVWGRIAYPSFTFGGRQGQGVCTVCFQKS